MRSVHLGVTQAAPTTRAVIYARYSSDLQREASIEDQVRVCQARAAHEGWTVASVLTDYALSGSSTLRPGYQQLLEQLRRGGVDVVLAESLDRFSRDQEHIAGFFKQARFVGVRVVTLAEGEVSELHIGLKGTMGALYLKDLADKTRRGLEGRVRQGRSGGGLCYGYRVVRGTAGRNGEPERGLREIDPTQAAVVRRIFEAFAAGESPIAIARRLNTEDIPGPRGGLWTDGALRGHARVGTGILRNDLYVGRLVWNRRRWLKDPATGRRVARQNGDDARVVEEVPELRIIEPALWERVQQRLGSAARPQHRAPAGMGGKADHLWHYRRAPTLLSGKVFCGTCGGAFITSGKDYMGCKAAIKQGTCCNTARVRRTRLEGQVLQALAQDLMQPEQVATFVTEFMGEWNRLQGGVGAQVETLQRELETTNRKLDSLIEAIADGLRAPGLQGKLDALGQRQAELQTAIAEASARLAAPRLHPSLAEVYRDKVGRLHQAMTGDGGREVLEAARALVERIEVSPQEGPGKPPRIELLGALSAMLRLAGAEGLPAARRTAGPLAVANGPDVFWCSGSVDAGTRKRLDLLLTG